MSIRKATVNDLSRIAEIYIFNNRLTYFPIFNNVIFSFKELQVQTIIADYFSKEDILNNIYVYDDVVVKGFIQVNGNELCKIYVDIFFQRVGVGEQLLNYAISKCHITWLWALEKNQKALNFYQKHGLKKQGDKQLLYDTEHNTEDMIKLTI